MLLTETGIASGHLTLADVMFLVAFVVFLVGAFLANQAKALWALAVAIGLALVSLGWFVL